MKLTPLICSEIVSKPATEMWRTIVVVIPVVLPSLLLFIIVLVPINCINGHVVWWFVTMITHPKKWDVSEIIKNLNWERLAINGHLINLSLPVRYLLQSVQLYSRRLQNKALNTIHINNNCYTFQGKISDFCLSTFWYKNWDFLFLWSMVLIHGRPTRTNSRNLSALTLSTCAKQFCIQLSITKNNPWKYELRNNNICPRIPVKTLLKI